MALLSPVLRLLIVDVRTCEEIFFSEERNKTVVACSEASWLDYEKIRIQQILMLDIKISFVLYKTVNIFWYYNYNNVVHHSFCCK